MLSRIAHSLYWIGRYVERAEDTARITSVNYQHTLGMGTSPEAAARRRRHWEALVTIVGDAPVFLAQHGDASEETVPPYLTFAADNPNSIVACIAAAREEARTMRHQIASEMWEALNRFHLELQTRQSPDARPVDLEHAYPFYRSIVDFSHLFQGITDSTMPREEGWYFLQTGKFLERAEKTARTLDVKYHLLVADAAPAVPVAGPGFAAAAAALAADGVPGEWHQWLAVLRSLSAYEAYHKLYRSAVRPRAVVEMLLLSPVFPRSIRFAIEEVDAALGRILAAGARAWDEEADDLAELATGGPTEVERAVGRLRSELAFSQVEDVFAAGLHDYFVELQRRCYRIGELIEAEFFAPRVLRAEEAVA